MEDKLRAVLEFHKAKHEYLGQGRSRMTFVQDENWVIKVPLNEEGIYDQYWEENTYKNQKSLGRYAECRVVHVDGIPLLIMERVKPVTSTKDLPKWTWAIDCQQVGYNKDGKLLAFDYGWN